MNGERQTDGRGQQHPVLLQDCEMSQLGSPEAGNRQQLRGEQHGVLRRRIGDHQWKRHHDTLRHDVATPERRPASAAIVEIAGTRPGERDQGESQRHDERGGSETRTETHMSVVTTTDRSPVGLLGLGHVGVLGVGLGGVKVSLLSVTERTTCRQRSRGRDKIAQQVLAPGRREEER